MTRLIVRKAGDPDLKANMPSVTCGVCGDTAQIPAEALGVGHWDELYGGEVRAEHEGLLPPGYSSAQWEHDRELEAWTQGHDDTHSQAEHDKHAKGR